MGRNKLKFWRRKLRLTQMQLAAAAHCSRATVILIERLNHYPGKDVRERIAAALSVSEDVIWPTLEVGSVR